MNVFRRLRVNYAPLSCAQVLEIDDETDEDEEDFDTRTWLKIFELATIGMKVCIIYIRALRKM